MAEGGSLGMVRGGSLGMAASGALGKEVAISFVAALLEAEDDFAKANLNGLFHEEDAVDMVWHELEGLHADFWVEARDRAPGLSNGFAEWSGSDMGSRRRERH